MQRTKGQVVQSQATKKRTHVVRIKYFNTIEYWGVFAALVHAAQSGSTVPYVAVAEAMGLSKRGNHMANEVGHLLGEISERETHSDRPMLSAIAVNRLGNPGKGFFVLAKRLGRMLGTNTDATFLHRERRRVFRTWS